MSSFFKAGRGVPPRQSGKSVDPRRLPRVFMLWAGLTILALASTMALFAKASANFNGQVIVYCAQDQVYAEPIFRQFQRQTGIRARTVFDSEAVKTVGLANRLLAERSHPQCDLFWANEEMRVRQLAARGCFRSTNGWATFGYRSRRIVINTNHISLDFAPRYLRELTNQTWRGKVALAYPQFGTTATQFHALCQHWGPSAWESWCRALAANKPYLVDGNSVVVKTVGRGDAWIGLTDSDDIAEGKQDGLPIVPLPITEETLLIPNAVAIVRNAPHPDAAQALFEFLQQPQIAAQLVNSNALEALSAVTPSASTLKVDWDALLRDLEVTTAKLNEIFLR